jgi:hypothetical protein
VKLRTTLEKGKAPDGIRRCAATILNAYVNVLVRRLTKLNSNPAAGMEMAAGKAHVCPDWGVLSVKVDIPREWQ